MRGRILALLAAMTTVPMDTQAQPNSGIALVESHAAYLARCRGETIARNPDMRAQAEAICQSNWTQIDAAGSMADAILTVAPREGVAFVSAAVRTMLPSVQWTARPEQGSVASGQLADIGVIVTQIPAPGITFRWFKNGEPIPFNLQEALRVRGAAATMIACLAFGSAEDTRVYRMTPAGKAPFALTIASRSAAVASQSSDFTATTDFSGHIPTLAELRGDGSEWEGACPQ
jgi:hypothetical protein